jgi:hypothetical protein
MRPIGQLTKIGGSNGLKTEVAGNPCCTEKIGKQIENRKQEAWER